MIWFRRLILVAALIAAGVGGTLFVQQRQHEKVALSEPEVARTLLQVYVDGHNLRGSDVPYDATCAARTYPLNMWDCSVGPQGDGGIASYLIEWDTFIVTLKNGRPQFAYNGHERPFDPYDD